MGVKVVGPSQNEKGGLEPMGQKEDLEKGTGHTKIVRTICDRCHCECGVLAHVRDGKVIKIQGDPNHPILDGSMCVKGLAFLQLVYHPDRIIYPMKRAGKRGEGKWQRISWDVALDMVAAKFKEIIKEYGPESVTWSWGDSAYRNTHASKQAWLTAMEAPNHLHSDAHYCFFPVGTANRATFGEFVTSEGSTDYRNTKCSMLWGGNPVMSHPCMARDIMIGKQNGAKLIVIDPRFTQTTSKADLWLQVRPGTDDALALSMLNVIINEELYDKEFVDKWCLGFEQLRERVQKYPPRWAADITWVPEEEIFHAARMYARNKPAVMHTRMGVCMNTNAVQTIRAISIMLAICGNLDVKGGNVFRRLPKGFKSRDEIIFEELWLPAEIQDKKIGAQEFPLFSGSHTLTGNFSHPPSVIHTMITEKPYPIKALWACNDLLVCLEGAMETREAIMNLDFVVGSDFFMTPTMELCDVILPPCTYLEREQPVDSDCSPNLIAARQKVIEPVGECRDEKDIDLELIRRMGLESPAEWQTAKEYNDYAVKGMGMTFEDFKKRGYIAEPIRYKRYEEEGFKTPSGKVELYSTIFEKFGYDPLPFYQENPETPISAPELAKEYPLILITGGRHVAYFHSSNRQIPWLRELVPEPKLTIHPETAAQLGIEDGGRVWIESPKDRGRTKMTAEVSESVHPKVVHAPSHWWFPEKKDPTHGCWDANINAILSNDPPYDPITGSTPLRGCLCKVYKVQEE
jgi:anaerobic selenocysteine-containing dehydrogenase